MNTILLLEDDQELNSTLSFALKRKGFDVLPALDANEAWDFIYEENIDIIISDIMMANVDGFDFVRMIREEDCDIPIMFISGRDDIEAKSRGFKEGIDDYMTKPLDFEELVLRINALLRRARIRQSSRIELSDFMMDEEERSAYVNGEEVKLTQREFDVLFKLLSYPRKAFSRARLLEEFWGDDSATSARAIDVFITHIREKTSKADSFEIVTVHGIGYKAVLR